MPTEYATYLMPGMHDDFFRWITTEVSPDYADGEVDSPTGWFCIVNVTEDDLALYVSEFGDPGTPRIEPKWYLVQTDSLGLIWANEYKLDWRTDVNRTRRLALADFSRLTREYNAWLQAVSA